MPYPNYCGGHKRLWTREKVIEGLRLVASELKGQLPTSDRLYLILKKGRYDWPGVNRIYEYFGSFPDAWFAAGIKESRISCHFKDWTPEEIEYIKEKAGFMSLPAIAKKLHRNQPGIRRKLHELKIKARDNQGYFSASMLAKEINTSCHRIRTWCKNGKLPATRSKIRNQWNIDFMAIPPAVMEELRKDRITHKHSPLDLGDYYQRYGPQRTIKDGKVKAVYKT
jgi:hypothetical protein